MNSVYFEENVLTDRERKNLSILDLLRRANVTTKTDISKSSKLNIVTVSNYVNEFVKKNLVLEREQGVSTGGRRPLLLELNSKYGYAVGLGINLFDIVGVLVDLKGNIIAKVKQERLQSDDPDILKDRLKNIIKELLSKSNVEKKLIRGIGIGLGGIIDKRTNTIKWPNRKGESFAADYSSIYDPFKDTIEKEFNIPVVMENDATVAALGEMWMQLETDVNNLLYFFSGIGTGLVINGQLYRGTSGSAGEISISSDSNEYKEFECNFGNSCFLKRWDPDLGITAEARAAIKQGRKSKIEKAIVQGKKVSPLIAEIFKAAREGDELAVELVKRAGKRLGIKIAFLANFLNPEIIIVGGGIEQAGALFFDEVKKTVDDWAFEVVSSSVRIMPSRLGENAVALGAASLVVRNMFVSA